MLETLTTNSFGGLSVTVDAIIVVGVAMAVFAVRRMMRRNKLAY